MKRITLWVLAVMSLLLLPFVATSNAALIEGGISFSGGGTLNGQIVGDADHAAATAFSSFKNVVVQDVSGSFAGIVRNTAATFTPFTFQPTGNVTPLWTVSVDEIDFSLDAFGPVMTVTKMGGAVPSLTVFGSGLMHITGFEDTPGDYKITAQTGGETFSFSSSSVASPVPEPATMMLLGSGLMGLAVKYRRKKRME